MANKLRSARPKNKMLDRDRLRELFIRSSRPRENTSTMMPSPLNVVLLSRIMIPLNRAAPEDMVTGVDVMRLRPDRRSQLPTSRTSHSRPTTCWLATRPSNPGYMPPQPGQRRALKKLPLPLAREDWNHLNEAVPGELGSHPDRQIGGTVIRRWRDRAQYHRHRRSRTESASGFTRQPNSVLSACKPRAGPRPGDPIRPNPTRFDDGHGSFMRCIRGSMACQSVRVLRRHGLPSPAWSRPRAPRPGKLKAWVTIG